MQLPDIHYRRMVYKACLLLIPVVTALGGSGVIPLPIAGVIGSVLGFFSNLLADRASSQLQKDGTLILSGSVQEQVNKGIDILTNQAVNTIDGLNQVGVQLDRLNKVKNDALDQVKNVPVLGPLAQQILDRLK